MENIDWPGLRGDSEILSACSVCAGDYEDPDWTVTREEAAEELDGDADDAAEDRHGGPASAEVFLSGEGMPPE